MNEQIRENEEPLNETKGTIHGFDIKQKAKITKEAMDSRIEYMKEKFYTKHII